MSTAELTTIAVRMVALRCATRTVKLALTSRGCPRSRACDIVKRARAAHK